MISLFVTAISLGFLGSFHCVGMCGPIALALPVYQLSPLRKYSSIFFYNAGRALTYGILGGIFGIIGQGIFIAGYQQILSIGVGISILIILFLPNTFISKVKSSTKFFSYLSVLKQRIGQLFRQKSFSSLFFIGTLNGLLPCGLVYLGVAGSIATGNALNGALFMVFFGLGTMPAMIAVSLFGNGINLALRNKIRKVVPVFVGLMALLLILRGLNLGIPYLSPEFSKDTKVGITNSCCHKK